LIAGTISDRPVKSPNILYIDSENIFKVLFYYYIT